MLYNMTSYVKDTNKITLTAETTTKPTLRNRTTTVAQLAKVAATQHVDATMNEELNTATSTAEIKSQANSKTSPTTSSATATKTAFNKIYSNLNNNNNNKMSNTTPTNDDTISCYDENSFSDGREKTDSTPENIKKIDEFINHHHHHDTTSSSLPTCEVPEAATTTSTVTTATLLLPPLSPKALAAATTDSSHPPPLSPTSAARLATLNSSSIVAGLGVVIDESNAKICLAKKSFEKDTSLKSNNNKSIESNEPTTAAAAAAIISNSRSNNCNNNHNDNRNSHGQNDAYVDEDDDSTSTATTATTTGGRSLAFTIDNFNDKDNDTVAQKARYKCMMERFQSRHRRGASMSKLETDSNGSGGGGGGIGNDKESNETTSPVTARGSGRQAQREPASQTNGATPTAEQPKVRMRVRDRSTSRVRDAAKRHSWSPRSSSSTTQELQLQQHNTTQTSTARVRSAAATAAAVKHSRLPPPAATKGAANLVANRTQFMPRSTAMQLALQKVDFLCPEPPLADYKHHEMNADDAASETGTYTLDGDNYTEEQKDYMNIDHSGMRSKQKVRPKDLAVKRGGGGDGTNGRRVNNNVLEVSYYHETPLKEKPTQKSSNKHRTKTTNETSDLILGAHQTAGEYLEQIKSRVLRNMSSSMGAGDLKAQTKAAPTTVDEESEDVGCFTSVTTSGVLAKQRALDKNPRLARCTSLSTSQIDSSEYVSNEVKLKNANQLAAAGGFTDHQKAEYRLNVFSSSGSKDTKFAATRRLISSPPETPTNCTPGETLISDTEVLKTAQTKEDWIQQWARNARARSLATESHKQQKMTAQELMTRSYTCAETGTTAESLLEDSIYNQQQQYNAKLNKSLAERYRLLGSGDCDYTSDPTLNAHTSDLNFKPPKSPSKIPSPLHSLGRARSASRSRPSLQAQQMLLSECSSSANPEDFLQKTAAVISNLQQSLSRKSSIKSPTHSNASPRSHAHHPAAHIFTPDECSPQHSLESASASSYRRSPMHRRNLSHETNYTSGGGSHSARENLMTSSVNESQLHLLTSGEYFIYKMNIRKNSLDAIASPVSPQHPYDKNQQLTPQDDSSMSPLRRSSSFSTTKLMAHQQQQQQQQPPHVPNRRARPQFQNIYTPPAARHQYGFTAAPSSTNAALLIKKSASSNNFGQIYSDYDDNLQYYINDEDEMGTGGEYYSSGEEGEFYNQQQSDAQGSDAAANAAPVSNTRLNKVLLMRIERSKQRQQAAAASGGTSSKPNSAPPGGKSSAGVIGNVACPNTPELPRRGIKSAPRPNAGPPAVTKCRQSMPRDTSLSRLANQVPSSLASAKKQLLQTAYGVPNPHASSKVNQRVQPKYMDISKYKPAQSNNFLRKNDAKSTLKSNGPPEYMKRSPSTSSIGLSRADPTRTSNRSVRSVQSVMNSSTTSLTSQSARGSSAIRRDASMHKQKEAEMAMWKRRSTYDPMKAAAEDRRRKEEARRLTQASKQSLADSDQVPFESARPANQTTITTSNYSPRNSMEPDNPDWMLGESSEYGEEDEHEDIEDYEQHGDEDLDLNEEDNDLLNINEEQFDDVFIEPTTVTNMGQD